MYYNGTNYSTASELQSVASGATLDFILPSVSAHYLIEVKDGSSGYLGSATLYISGVTNELRVVDDSTTSSLMGTGCVPTLFSVNHAQGSCVLRFTNASVARKIAVSPLYSPAVSANLRW